MFQISGTATVKIILALDAYAFYINEQLQQITSVKFQQKSHF